MKLFSRVVAITALALGIATAAGAAPITEVEFNGTIAAAQVIPASAFTTPVPGTVFNPPGFPTATISGLGGSDDATDVDFYAFMANGGDVYFDIDDDPFTVDTILALFDSSGALLAFDDDSFGEDPGTEVGFDSFLGVFTLPGPGTYYIAVSQFPNFPTALVPGLTFAALSRPDGSEGGNAVIGAAPGESTYTLGPQRSTGTMPYTLHISAQNAGTETVPEPVTLLLFGAGLTATAVRKRRR
jgi:hypothetical protein